MTRSVSAIRLPSTQNPHSNSDGETDDDFNGVITRIQAPTHSPTSFTQPPPSPREVQSRFLSQMDKQLNEIGGSICADELGLQEVYEWIV